MDRFQNRVIIVTGAGSGIGRAVCLQFAKEGGSVVAADLNAQALQTLATDIAQMGSEVFTVECDVADPSTGTRLAATAESQFGRLHGLVPCAGIIRFKCVTELDAAQWDAVMNVNLRGTFLPFKV